MRNYISIFLLSFSYITNINAQILNIKFDNVNTHIMSQHVEPRYQIFLSAAQNLKSKMGNFCAQKENITTAQEAFHSAVDAWQNIEHIRWGPTQQFNAHARLFFWPDNRDFVSKHLRRLLGKNQNIKAKLIKLESSSVAIQGFPALEQLLFTGTDKIYKNNKLSNKKCLVILSISKNIHNIARALKQEWRKHPFPNTPPKQFTNAILKNLVSGLSIVSNQKLWLVFNPKSGKIIEARAQNNLSGRSLHNIHINLVALNHLYEVLVKTISSNSNISIDNSSIREAFNNLLSITRQGGRSLIFLLRNKDGKETARTIMSNITQIRTSILEDFNLKLKFILGFNNFDGD